MLSPLAERPFMLFFWARVASLLGDKVVHVALAFAVLDLTPVAIGAPLTMGVSFVAIGLMSFGMLGIRGVRELTRRSIAVSEPVTAPISPLVGPESPDP
jgi:hypothetical protein